MFLALMQSEEQRGWAQGRKCRLGQYRSHASLNIMGSRPQTFGCQVNTLQMATVWGGGQRTWRGTSCFSSRHCWILRSIFCHYLWSYFHHFFQNFVPQNLPENLICKYILFNFFFSFFFKLLGYWPFAQRRRDIFLRMMKAAASILAWAWGLSLCTSPWVFWVFWVFWRYVQVWEIDWLFVFSMRPYVGNEGMNESDKWNAYVKIMWE